MNHVLLSRATLGCGPGGCSCSCGGGCGSCGSCNAGTRAPFGLGLDPGAIINPSWLPPTVKNPLADYPALPPLTVVSDPVPDPFNITYGLDAGGNMIVTGTGTQGDLTPTFDYSPPASAPLGLPRLNWGIVAGGAGLALLIALGGRRGRRR